MSRHRVGLAHGFALVTLVGAVGVAGCPAASAEERAAIVALHAPNLPFGSPAERSAWVAKAAAHLEAETGSHFVGRNFARVPDLLREVRSGSVAVAVVDPILLVLHARGLVPLFQATGAGGRASFPLAVMGRGVGGLPGLTGETLILPDSAGAHLALVRARALRDEAEPREVLGRVDVARDARSAASAVVMGKARAALLPRAIGAEAGLDLIAEAGEHPLPVLVAAGGAKTPADLEAIRRAWPGVPAPPSIQGWRPGNPGGEVAALVSDLSAARRRRTPLPAHRPWLSPAGVGVGSGASPRLPVGVMFVSPPAPPSVRPSESP